MNSYFMLRALAAREMPHERKALYPRAAREPVIHADRSMDQRSNSYTADKAALRRLQRPTIVGSQKTDGLARSQLETRGIDSIMFFVGLSCQNPEYP